LAAALGLTLGSAGSASAGGPTSVLIVSPGSGETASLYHSDQRYGELEQQLGAPGSWTAEKPAAPDTVLGAQINVTWMLHDVTPWRVDRVHLAAGSKDVWIHTAENLDRSTNGAWHRAEHPTELRDLLDGLGVKGEASGGGSAVDYPPPWDMYGTDAEAGTGTAPADDTDAADPSPAAASAQRPGSGDGTDWWWALPGLAAGAVLALVLRPFATRLPGVPSLQRWRLREPGPRQELRDL
jgi:hypothetical protein